MVVRDGRVWGWKLLCETIETKGQCIEIPDDVVVLEEGVSKDDTLVIEILSVIDHYHTVVLFLCHVHQETL